MRKLDIIWHGDVVGTLAVPDSLRPPLSDLEVETFSRLAFRSRSWLFDVRPGDLTLELRGNAYVVIASNKLGPGDVGCLVGYEAADGRESFCDEKMIALADDILREAQLRGRPV